MFSICKPIIKIFYPAPSLDGFSGKRRNFKLSVFKNRLGIYIIYIQLTEIKIFILKTIDYTFTISIFINGTQFLNFMVLPLIKYQISCVIRDKGKEAYNCISFIGGFNGSYWRIAIEKAIEGIENGKWQFYIDKDGQKIDVIISILNGKKYLKTIIDDELPDALLKLPDCF